MFRKFLFIFLFIPIPFLSGAQLRINEFMASNLSGIEDPMLGQTGDWIELITQEQRLLICLVIVLQIT